MRAGKAREVLSTSEQGGKLEAIKKRCPAFRHLLRLGAENASLVRHSEVKQGSQVGVKAEEMQSGAHKFSQAPHSREAPIRCRAGRGKRRQEGPERIHGPPFFPEGQEGKICDCADCLEQKLADCSGTLCERRVYEYAARLQTAKEALE